jgi:hypothetical protein
MEAAAGLNPPVGVEHGLLRANVVCSDRLRLYTLLDGHKDDGLARRPCLARTA